MIGVRARGTHFSSNAESRASAQWDLDDVVSDESADVLDGWDQFTTLNRVAWLNEIRPGSSSHPARLEKLPPHDMIVKRPLASAHHAQIDAWPHLGHIYDTGADVEFWSARPAPKWDDHLLAQRAPSLAPVKAARSYERHIYAQDVATHVMRRVLREANTWHDRGADLAAVKDPWSWAQEMVEVTTPDPTGWDALVGPFLSLRTAARRLRLSEDALDALIASHALLGLRSQEGVTLLPEFQFRGRRLLPGLVELIEALPFGQVSGWTLAGWMVAPHHDLEDHSPVDWLAEENDVDLLLEVARDAASTLLR